MIHGSANMDVLISLGKNLGAANVQKLHLLVGVILDNLPQIDQIFSCWPRPMSGYKVTVADVVRGAQVVLGGGGW